jgi:hypothetical protein
MRIEIGIVLGAFGAALLPYGVAIGGAAKAAETSEPCTVIEMPGEGVAIRGGSSAGGVSSSVTVGGGKGSATTSLGSRSDAHGSSVRVHSGGGGSAAVATGSASANGTTVVTGSGGDCVITTPDSDKTK